MKIIRYSRQQIEKLKKRIFPKTRAPRPRPGKPSRRREKTKKDNDKVYENTKSVYDRYADAFIEETKEKARREILDPFIAKHTDPEHPIGTEDVKQLHTALREYLISKRYEMPGSFATAGTKTGAFSEFYTKKSEAISSQHAEQQRLQKELDVAEEEEDRVEAQYDIHYEATFGGQTVSPEEKELEERRRKLKTQKKQDKLMLRALKQEVRTKRKEERIKGKARRGRA